MLRSGTMCFAAALWLLSAGSCDASVRFLAGLGGDRLFGHTAFEISVTEKASDASLPVNYKSNLEFPVDVYLAAFSAGIGGTVRKGKPWSVTLGLRHNLNDPSGPMTDKDWLEIPEYSIQKTFSYTESEAGLRALIIDVNARCTLFVHPDFTIDAMLGYRHQHFAYELFGVKGWQLDEFLHRVEFDEFSGVNVLDYEVTHRIPYLGVAAEIGDPTSFSLRGEFAYSPVASAEDFDDHILRNKSARTKAKGTAVIASARTIWALPWGTGTCWHAVVGGELATMSTRGDQTQSWYGDDPASPDEDDTGLVLAGIDNKITGTIYSVNAAIGCRF
jgi:hypothetical protein